ncbi:MAG: hypothetical protein J7L14_02370 [Candidatus Diapherotrites archaeon]|nr:hypothetical protein [Candidatus Diapherotrites archaeon]
MVRKVKLTVLLEEPIVKKMDEVIKKAPFGNRTLLIKKAVVELLKPYLSEEEKRAFEALFSSGGEE